MKYLIPLFAVLLMVSCKTNDILQYQYKSATMIGSKTMTITKDSIIVVFNGRGKKTYDARLTTPEEWEELELATSRVDLKDLNTLESPSNMRQTDASPYGTIFLTTKDSTYNTQSFDGYNSHESLLPLMGVIKKIANADRPERP